MPRRTRIDWFEALLSGLGVVFAILAVLCLIGLISVVASWGDPDVEFTGGEGFVRGLKGVGVALVAVGFVVFTLVAWWLLADRVRALLRRSREEE
jgi:hypothetical protein